MTRPAPIPGRKPGRPRKTAEERMGLVILAQDPEISTRALAKRCGVTSYLVRKWRRQWDVDGTVPLERLW